MPVLSRFLYEKLKRFISDTVITHKILRDLSRFIVKMKEYNEGMLGPFKQAFDVMLEANKTRKGVKVDMDKVYYLEQMFLMLNLAMKSFFENMKNEALNLCKYMLRLSTLVPDHRLTKLSGALLSFQKMRDAAEDIHDFVQEIDAYYKAGLTLKRTQQYAKALLVFKRMLQVAWNNNKQSAEMLAYSMIGRMYFYLGNIHKANYYNERSIKGQTEAPDSKTKLISATHYRHK
jgi:tetratricopeptide (TPR) repeat protein